MQLPSARGPLSTLLVETLRGQVTLDGDVLDDGGRLATSTDAVADEDLQLSLWMLYELHYSGFEDADDGWEWDPELLRLRRGLEAVFEADLRRRTGPQVNAAVAAEGDVATRLFDLTGAAEGPPVARFIQRDASREQFSEFMIHRSIYHLKESDPQAWVIPRIIGKPKAALVELLYDEYGAGRPDRLHATMFGDAVEACGLERAYGAYIDQVPACTLATNNAMSLLGLHRRLRAASAGHLGAFEATSSLPCRRFVGGIRRLGLPEQVAGYFDEHIEADAVHEQLALRDVCGELVRQDPSLEEDVFFGASVCLQLEAVAGEQLLDAWQSGRSSLREVGCGLAPGPEAVA